MTIIGYARVSTIDQDLSIQEAALRAAVAIEGDQIRDLRAFGLRQPQPLAGRHLDRPERSGAVGGLKGALVVLVLILMGLNVIGAFGFLAKAHIGHQIEGETAVAGRAADIEAQISVQADTVADLDRRIGQIDNAVEKSTAKGRTDAAMQLAADQRRNRAELRRPARPGCPALVYSGGSGAA